MNIENLKQSIDFQEFMKRVAELGKDASDLLKTETDLLKIGRAQGRLMAIDDVADLLSQIEAEQTLSENANEE